MPHITHFRLSIQCSQCGNARWLSIVRMSSAWDISIITCAFCDAEDADRVIPADEPFED